MRLRGEWLILEGEVEEAVKALVRDGYRVREVTRDYFDLYEYYRERVQHA